MDLGPGTDNVGVRLSVRKDQVNVQYQKPFNPQADEDLLASLDTQLRIALSLFWRKLPVAVPLCSYTAEVTSQPPLYPQVNTQAVALGQQLAAQAMAGPSMGYAPVLNMQSYKENVRDALQAAWGTMLQQAITQKQIRTKLAKFALDRYSDAQAAATLCLRQLAADNAEIDAAAAAFQQGLANWVARQSFQAAVDIMGGDPQVCIRIATLAKADASKMPDAFTSLKNVINAFVAAQKMVNQRGKKVSSATVKMLAVCMTVLEKLYPTTDTMVKSVKKLESDPKAKVPALDNVAGSREDNAYAQAIVTLAACDKWILESAQQLEFAVSQAIGGASAYRLVLQKHGVSGKALAQAQAESVKSGYGYNQAEMEVIACIQDIATLKELRKKFQGQEAVYAQAEAKFFTRFLSIRTSLVMKMRKLVWAYKYWALEDSSLPSKYGALMLDGLKRSHRASFTLAPADPNGQHGLASVFTKGSHFCLDGLEVFLRGAVPRPDAVDKNGVGQVDIQLLTSGVYADIKDGKVFHFAGEPRSVRPLYDLDSSGKRGGTRVHATFLTTEHAEPTPFTQWTINLRQPELLDLSGLAQVDLEWTGKARFSDSSSKIVSHS
ncbi:hypothetical protein BDW62DRAFT_217924 [Aspergillus aurantiobrunneus]